MKSKAKDQKFLMCIRNDDCEDLMLHKVYRVRQDKKAEIKGYIRVVDESGEDYLYPESFFTEVKLSHKAQEALLTAH